MRSIWARSSGVNRTSRAPILSSRYRRRLVPGMGTMSSLWASTQASASCAAVQPFLAASAHLLDEIEIPLEVRPAEARVVAPPVVRRKIFGAFDLAREKSSTEWTIGNKAD